MNPSIFDPRRCQLGEGPLWHPTRRQLFWVDILGQRLMTREIDAEREWQFDRPISALGLIGDDALLVAGAGELMRFDIATGSREQICPLEADRPDLRSNDGRADLHGGFWIGTMGLKAERGAGSIWRYYRGEMRHLFDGITIPNAISFSPDGGFACFADTIEKLVWRQPLGSDGWPVGEREVFLDLRGDGLLPDGAVFDREGYLWLACWGSSSVIRFATDGHEDVRVRLPVTQPSCPAFGGEAGSTLYVTSARERLSDEALAAQPLAGSVFALETGQVGVAEPRVVL